MTSLLKIIDNVNEWAGRIVSFLIFPIIGVVIFEVIMRYFLRHSQLWVPEISVFFFGALFVLGGGYLLLHEGHVKLDIVYNHFGTKGKALADIVTSIFFFFVVLILIWKGWATAWQSLITMEHSPSAFSPLLFPIRMVIPIGVGLLMIQGIAKLIRDIYVLSGRNSL